MAVQDVELKLRSMVLGESSSAVPVSKLVSDFHDESSFGRGNDLVCSCMKGLQEYSSRIETIDVFAVSHCS
jgi:hypothetical protein